MHQVALGAVKRQDHRSTGAGGYAQFGLAGTGGSTHVAVVHHRIGRLSGCCLRDFVYRHAHIGGTDCEIRTHADKFDTGRRCFQRGPLARDGCRVSIGFLAQQRQSKLHSAQAQANGPALECAVGLVPTTNTGKGTQLAPAYGQHVHADLAGRLGHRPISRDHRITQGDLLRALLQRQVALDRKEAKYIERQVAAGLEQVAFGAVHAQLECAGGARGNVELGLARTRGSAHVAVVHYQCALGLGCNLGGAAHLL